MNTAAITNVKAIAFGIVATVALGAGLVHAEAQREQAAKVIRLDTVYITGKRVVPADAQVAQTLPTVYITGKRSAQADVQVAQTLPTVYITGKRTVDADAERVQVAAL